MMNSFSRRSKSRAFSSLSSCPSRKVGRACCLGGILVAGAGLGFVGLSMWLEVQNCDSCEVDLAAKPHQAMKGYPETYWSQNLKASKSLNAKPLGRQLASADVCVIGGGFAGLCTALSLAERGKSVVVLERHKVGWAASGRNAGMCLTGFQLELPELVSLLGSSYLVRKMYEFTTHAKALLLQRIQKHKIKCDVVKDGCLTVSLRGEAKIKAEAEEEAFVDQENEITALNKAMGTSYQFWRPKQVQKVVHSTKFSSGWFDPEGFSVDPLKLVLGLAFAATHSKKVSIFEDTAATTVRLSKCDDKSPSRWTVSTMEGGTVFANDVVLAGGTSLGKSVDWMVAGSTVPLYTYIGVTEPVGKLLDTAVSSSVSVCDDRFALNYFRTLPGGRLLWGGKATMWPLSLEDVKQKAYEEMTQFFPQLAGVQMEHVWGGNISITYPCMPLIGCKKPGLWYATGFAGHGLIPTTMAGEMIAKAIVEDDDSYKVFQEQFKPYHTCGVFGRAGAQLFLWKQVLSDYMRCNSYTSR